MGKSPISVSDILVVADPTARHRMPWLRGLVSMRPLTLREILRVAADHPGIVEWIDPEKPVASADDILAALGRDAVVEVLGLAMGKARWKLRRLPAAVLVHGLATLTDITFGSRSVTDFFADPPRNSPPGSGGTPREEDRRLIQMVRDAAEYSARTGTDALSMSPAALAFGIRTMAEIDRHARVDAARAHAAIHDKKAAESLMEI